MTDWTTSRAAEGSDNRGRDFRHFLSGGDVGNLSDKQKRFAQMVAGLIQHAEALGYGVTLGEAWRSGEEAARLAKAGAGIGKSLHCSRLAIDLNLWRGDIYLTASSDYAALGAWWEGQGGAWGGRFGDGNHFSIEHEGRK